jgi:thioester reductase-like protein
LRISYTNVFAHPTPRELASLLSSDNEGREIPDDDKYDYSEIHSLLAEGNLNAFRQSGTRKIANVLLTGATGFLGIHMLHGLLKSTHGNVCCLARRSKNIDADKRLRNLLFYYFEDVSDWEGRLRIIDGDMTDKTCLDGIKNIDTVINCAANVTHFAKDSSTFDVNIGGVKNLIEFCRKSDTRLIHISTASIAGLSVGGFPSKDVVMDETMLFFGQNLENQYIHSKFMAERAVLEAALDGLDAKIMRVGNLMARSKDGEFQINAKANSFLGRLRAYHAIGCFPYSSYHMTTELAPIDSTTAAVLRLAETSGSCRVFHPYNNHRLFMGDIILTMKDLGISIEMVEDDVFESALSAAMKDLSRAESLTSLIAYQNMAQGKAAFPVAAKNDYTTQVLLRLGWRWPETDSEYLRKFLTGLMGLGFFAG